MLLLLLDGPAFFYAFFGAIKIGAVPVPLNTLWKPHDYEYVVRDSRAVWSSSAPSFCRRSSASPAMCAESVRTSSSWRRRRRAQGPRALVGEGSDRPRCRADQPGRAGVLAVFLGQHRRAEGLRPSAPRHGGVRGAVCEGRARHPPARPLLQRGQAVLRVRPRQRALLSVLGWRDDDPVAGSADAAARLRGHREAPADVVLSPCRPVSACCWRTNAPTRRRISTSRRSVSASPLARRCRRRSTNDSSTDSVSTSWTASDPPKPRHMFISNRPGRDPSRFERPDRRGLRRADSGRRGTAGAARGDWEPLDPRRLGLRRLLESAREDEAHD